MSPACRCASATSPWCTSSSSTTRRCGWPTTSPRRCACAAPPISRRACGPWPNACISSTCWTAIRPNCPAASSSAWRWRARWSRTRRWCCWTNRWSTWTTSCAKPCAKSWPACSPRGARPWSMPPPSPPRPCCWAAIPRCSTPAGCCNTVRPPRSSIAPIPSGWRGPSAIPP
ncbi:Uncharacterised protein [Bordetella pertussis]|nr:Uncharacterised protein [Bordetella pertussis]